VFDLSKELDEVLKTLRKIDEKISSIRFPSLFGSKGEATFRAKVSEGKIRIPKTELELLGLHDGDFVQVSLTKIKTE